MVHPKLDKTVMVTVENWPEYEQALVRRIGEQVPDSSTGSPRTEVDSRGLQVDSSRLGGCRQTLDVDRGGPRKFYGRRPVSDRNVDAERFDSFSPAGLALRPRGEEARPVDCAVRRPLAR